MKGLSIGKQDFKKIIVNNMIYVDKIHTRTFG